MAQKNEISYLKTLHSKLTKEVEKYRTIVFYIFSKTQNKLNYLKKIEKSKKQETEIENYRMSLEERDIVLIRAKTSLAEQTDIAAAYALEIENLKKDVELVSREAGSEAKRYKSSRKKWAAKVKKLEKMVENGKSTSQNVLMLQKKILELGEGRTIGFEFETRCESDLFRFFCKLNFLFRIYLFLVLRY